MGSLGSSLCDAGTPYGNKDNDVIGRITTYVIKGAFRNYLRYLEGRRRGSNRFLLNNTSGRGGVLANIT